MHLFFNSIPIKVHTKNKKGERGSYNEDLWYIISWVGKKRVEVIAKTSREAEVEVRGL